MEQSLVARRGEFIAAVGLAAVFLALRIDIHAWIYNPDETIVLGVSQAMSRLRRLDPNWALATDTAMHPSFLFDFYNFYSYNVLSHFILRANSVLLGLPALSVLRTANVVYQLVAVGFAIATARKVGVGSSGQWSIAVLLTVAPALVHDAHIARCESLLYALFAAAAYFAVSGRFLVVGLLIGVGVASKVSFLAAGLVVLPAVFRGYDWKAVAKRGVAVAAGVLIGFIVSAPYAVLHFPIFVHTVERLNHAYHNQFPPHTLIEPSPILNATRVAIFLTMIYGTLIAAGIAAIVFTPRPLWGVWAASALTLVYFAPVPMFAERNFALAVFGFIIVAGAMGDTRKWKIPVRLMLLLALLPMAYWSTQIAIASGEHGQRRIAWQQARFGATVPLFWSINKDPSAKIPKCDGVFGLVFFQEDYSNRTRRFLLDHGYEELDRYRSRFSRLPVSTLYTYLESDMIYYRCAPLRG